MLVFLIELFVAHRLDKFLSVNFTLGTDPYLSHLKELLLLSVCGRKHG